MSWDDEKLLEVRSRSKRNLGTFSTTFMDAKPTQIYNTYASLNAVDSSAYPEFIDMEQQCGHFLLDLFHADNSKDYTFFNTSGSSEALFMSLLFMKNHWKQQHPHDSHRLNFIIGSSAHTAWHKAANYLDVDLKVLPVHPTKLNLDENHLLGAIDSNTIGISATLGATTTLVYDEIEKINIALNDYRNKKNRFIPLHVDAASGGFVAPFAQKGICWDFRLNHVMSINVSSHKFGQVYPSLGWLCVRNELRIDDLAHESHYLGKAIKRFPIQFSHSASPLATQSYYIKTYGQKGYESLITRFYEQRDNLCKIFKKFEEIKLITPNDTPNLPGIILSLNDHHSVYHLAGLASSLALHGWHLPTFRLPVPCEDILAARIIVRNGFDKELLQALEKDIANYFMSTPE